MFERFTERAQQVVALAQDEARQLRHAYVGTEHLLLGLIREGEGSAARALSAHAVELDPVRTWVARVVGQGDDAAPGRLPLTPRVERIVALAENEAQA